MVERGAKYIILLSRSGTKQKTTKELIEELSVAGTTIVALSCDISDGAVLKDVTSS
jgi:hypothetical protein